jgi:MFS superfamily sulfate permease-like transporter
LRFIPPALAAVVLASVAAYIQQLDIKFVELPDKIYQAISMPSAEMWQTLQAKGVKWHDIALLGLSFGIVASAETLLSVTATDRIHQGPRAKYDKELIAQGVGNLLCGAASALPITGVIVRSSANIDAGARTRLSAILHGAWILIFVSLLPHTLQAIPKSCLGAILVYTGYKLAYPRAAMGLLKYGKSELLIYAATLGMIVFTDLLTGVLVGIGLSAIKLLYTFSHLAIDVRKNSATNRVNLKLEGAATFLRLPYLAKTLEGLPPACELHVDIATVDYIDHACLDLLINWQRQHEGLGGKLVIDWGGLHAKFLGRYNDRNGKVTLPHPRELQPAGHH